MVNVDQARAWDGESGEHWAAHAAHYDRALREHNEHLQAGAHISAHERVLDIGCGNGVSTRDAARAASSGRAVGIDLSTAMLDVARSAATREGVTNVEFVHGDAQSYPFDPGSFDVAISRFGVMFFADPIAAFANVYRALAPGGRLALVVWTQPEQNQWYSEVVNALAAGRTLAPPPSGEPGPFGWADAGFVRTVLGGAGFSEISLDPFHAAYPAGDDADEAFAYARGLGFSRQLLQDLDDATQARALDALRAVIDAHATGGAVTFDSVCWLVTASRP